MTEDISHKLRIGISSRALFDLTKSNEIFEKQGLDAYIEHQISHENDILEPGVAFPMVQKLLDINNHGDLVEVILLSRNSADTSLRIFNSILHHQLKITRATFTNGHNRYKYVKAFDTHLFLSANPEDVQSALNAGIAAATILPNSKSHNASEELRIAFDGDSVLFSDEAERVFQSQGEDAFHQNEHINANNPLNGGPFQGFLTALHNIQKLFPINQCPIRTSLITARQAPAHERVIRTLRSWNIRVDEAVFLGGLNKAAFLQAFGADIFFDDQPHNCQAASQHVTAAHVPHGIVNETKN